MCIYAWPGINYFVSDIILQSFVCQCSCRPSAGYLFVHGGAPNCKSPGNEGARATILYTQKLKGKSGLFLLEIYIHLYSSSSSSAGIYIISRAPVLTPICTPFSTHMSACRMRGFSTGANYYQGPELRWTCSGLSLYSCTQWQSRVRTCTCVVENIVCRCTGNGVICQDVTTQNRFLTSRQGRSLGANRVQLKDHDTGNPTAQFNFRGRAENKSTSAIEHEFEPPTTRTLQL